MSGIVLSFGQPKISLASIARFNVKQKQKRRWGRSPNLTFVGCFFIVVITPVASIGILFKVISATATLIGSSISDYLVRY